MKRNKLSLVAAIGLLFAIVATQGTIAGQLSAAGVVVWLVTALAYKESPKRVLGEVVVAALLVAVSTLTVPSSPLLPVMLPLNAVGLSLLVAASF